MSDIASVKNLDKIFAFLGMLFSFYIMFTFGIVMIRPVYALAGMFIFLSSVTWLIIGKNASLDSGVKSFHTYQELLPVAYFILLFVGIASVFVRSNLYQRPFLFFVIISVLAGIIFLEINYLDVKWRYVILIQIISLGLTFSWTQIILFQGFIGIDTWWHYYITEKISTIQHMPTGYGYSFLPLFHLFVYSSQLITGLDYRSVVVLSLTFLQIVVMVLALYLISSYLIKNERVALLAALFPVIANYTISLMYQPVPNSLAAIFIPVVIYLLLKMRGENRFAYLSVVLVFLMVIIFMHTITALFMGIVLFLFEIGTIIYDRLHHKRNPSYFSGIFALFIVIMLVWWEYVSGSMTELITLFDSGFSPTRFIHAAPELLQYARNIPISEQIFNMLGIFLFFSISLIGLLYLIRERNPQYFIVAVAFISPLLIGFGSLIGGYSIIEVRWWFFAEMLLSIAIAIGIMIFLNSWKNQRYAIPFMGCFLVFLTLVMLLHPLSNVDYSPYPANSRVRFAYTDSELGAAEFFATMPMDRIASDFNFCDNKSINPLVDFYNVPYYKTGTLDPYWYQGNFTQDGIIKLIRQEVALHPFRISGSLYKLNYDPNQLIDGLGFNKIFESPSVSAYL